MKYTVEVNASKRTVSVMLDGYKGTARCCPTDTFDLTVGTELALERARVAKKNAEKKKTEKAKEVKPTTMATQMTATMLARQLEKVLPKGQIIVAVGGGDNCLTEQGKKWLATLAGVSTKCHCSCCDCDEDDEYENGYNDGYADGYADAEADCDDSEVDELGTALARIREVLADVGITI
jgi:hypothetical protein